MIALYDEMKFHKTKWENLLNCIPKTSVSYKVCSPCINKTMNGLNTSGLQDKSYTGTRKEEADEIFFNTGSTFIVLEN